MFFLSKELANELANVKCVILAPKYIGDHSSPKKSKQICDKKKIACYYTVSGPGLFL